MMGDGVHSRMAWSVCCTTANFLRGARLGDTRPLSGQFSLSVGVDGVHAGCGGPGGYTFSISISMLWNEFPWVRFLDLSFYFPFLLYLFLYFQTYSFRHFMH